MTRVAWISFAVVGAACSLCYQMILAKILAKLSGDVMVWESLSTGVFLLFMGFGSFRFASKRKAASVESLIRVEVALSLVGIAAPLLIYALHLPYRIYIFDSGILNDLHLVPTSFQFAALNLLFPALVGYISGFELPMLLQIGARHRLSEKFMLASYYAGALLGTLLFVWWLHPDVDPMVAGGFVALFNLLLIMALVFAARTRLSLFGFTAPMALVAIAFYGLIFAHPPLRSMWAANFYYNKLGYHYTPLRDADFQWPEPVSRLPQFSRSRPPIENYRSLYREIDIVRDEKDPSHFSVHLDGHFQFGSRTADDYHQHFVHVPAMAFGTELKKVLVLGGGDGLVAKELLRYEDAEITLVDLDHQVVDLARTHRLIRELNGGSLEDPRVKVVIADAFTYLIRESHHYDAILIDFTYPFDFDSARLFSAEFFALVRSRLAPDGWAVAISPVDFLNDEPFADMKTNDQLRQMVRHTLGTAGFSSFLAFNCDQGEFLAMGRKADPRMGDAVLDLSLDHLKPTYIYSSRWRVYDATPGELANRLLLPTFRGVPDTFF